MLHSLNFESIAIKSRTEIIEIRQVLVTPESFLDQIYLHISYFNQKVTKQKHKISSKSQSLKSINSYNKKEKKSKDKFHQKPTFENEFHVQSTFPALHLTCYRGS